MKCHRITFLGSNWQWVTTSSGNGLVPSTWTWPAITIASVDQDLCCHMVLLWVNADLFFTGPSGSKFSEQKCIWKYCFQNIGNFVQALEVLNEYHKIDMTHISTHFMLLRVYILVLVFFSCRALHNAWVWFSWLGTRQRQLQADSAGLPQLRLNHWCVYFCDNSCVHWFLTEEDTTHSYEWHSYQGLTSLCQIALGRKKHP